MSDRHPDDSASDNRLSLKFMFGCFTAIVVSMAIVVSGAKELPADGPTHLSWVQKSGVTLFLLVSYVLIDRFTRNVTRRYRFIVGFCGYVCFFVVYLLVYNLIRYSQLH